MERVSEIRADIAENAAHINNKILLRDLRAVSQLFVAHCSNDFSDEDVYRFLIIRNVLNTKKVDNLPRTRIIVDSLLSEIKPPCASAKRGGGL